MPPPLSPRALIFTVFGLYLRGLGGWIGVSRLIALSYVTLGLAFLINLLLVRFRVAEQLFGRCVQEQCYLVLRWVFPVLVLTTAGAMILSAIA